MRRRSVLLAASLLAVSFNLRPAIGSVGPVLGDVRAGLGLTASGAALLTTLPVLCFGVLALIAPRLARRYGIEAILGAVMGLLAAALLLRVVAGTICLFVGTAVAAGAIAVGNVLVPALIKRDFSAQAGSLLGAYTAVLAGSGALAAGLTVPAVQWLGGGWRTGLAVWAVPAAVALLFWLPEVQRRGRPAPVAAASGEMRRILHSSVAWHVTGFMGVQSLGFYAVLAWLPTIYQDQGWTPASSGALLAVSVLVQVPITILVPMLAVRLRDQRLLAMCTTLSTACGLMGVLLAPTTAAWFWASLLGIGQGGGIAVALTLFVLRTDSTADTAALSAMAQSIGYTFAALGPLLLGVLHEGSGGWAAPLVVLLLLCAGQCVLGILAGRSRTTRFA